MIKASQKAEMQNSCYKQTIVLLVISIGQNIVIQKLPQPIIAYAILKKNHSKTSLLTLNAKKDTCEEIGKLKYLSQRLKSSDSCKIRRVIFVTF